ncbi:uncharacterized protein N7459_000199 [Penicillium hispanicum]|uniref:uncharacterized protein n=1 Tax=Penicillium hispanicum TaxID=1080232 RepID=UPI002540F4B3|nr:uncharacterized protein N7459_000199 [Penicillium hispanicum]KAJ5593991.1 hypothetical protein N7459_000199 [Penicillium hispanicum]
MNWTGGQLRRHSARQGVLSKTQRQNFAKSRQLANSRTSGSSTPFCGFPSLSIPPGGLGAVAEAQTQTINLTTSPLSETHPLNQSSRSGILKHRLLQNPDWAAVSAARPLEIAFAPVEETERFGKRRRLNETDRRRLSASHNEEAPVGTLQRLFTSRRGDHAAEQSVNLGQLKIRINGKPAGLRSSDSRGMTMTTNPHSSQSMLLDHEQSASIHHMDTDGNEAINTWRLNRISLPPSYGRTSFQLGMSRDDAPNTPTVKNLHFVDSSLPRASNLGSLIPNSQPYDAQPGSSQRTSPAEDFSHNAATSSIQERPHFTIDDQEIAEKMGLTITPESVRRPDCESVNSPREMLAPSPTLIITDAFPENKSSSWLSRPHRLSYSRSPHLSPRDTKLPGSEAHDSFYPGVSTVSQQSVRNGSSTVPVKIFGQIVSLKNSHIVSD